MGGVSSVGLSSSLRDRVRDNRLNAFGLFFRLMFVLEDDCGEDSEDSRGTSDFEEDPTGRLARPRSVMSVQGIELAIKPGNKMSTKR